MLLLAHRRYRTYHQRLTAARDHGAGLPDGALPALLVGTGVGAALLALLLAVTTAG